MLTLYEQEGTGLSFRKRELLHLATVANLPYNSVDKTTSWLVKKYILRLTLVW